MLQYCGLSLTLSLSLSLSLSLLRKSSAFIQHNENEFVQVLTYCKLANINFEVAQVFRFLLSSEAALVPRLLFHALAL